MSFKNLFRVINFYILILPFDKKSLKTEWLKRGNSPQFEADFVRDLLFKVLTNLLWRGTLNFPHNSIKVTLLYIQVVLRN